VLGDIHKECRLTPLKTFSFVDNGLQRCYLGCILPDISPLSVRRFLRAGQEEVHYRDIIEIMP